MYRGHIPGYYWDQEKGKYFKVQPNHVAPSGVKYSQDNIKKSAEEGKKRKRSEDKAKIKREHLVQKERLLRNPLAAGIGVHSETGHKSPAEIRELRVQAFTQGLKRHVCLDLSDDIISQLGLLPVRSVYEIQCFDYDKETNGLVLGISRQSPTAIDSLVSVLPRDESTWPTGAAWCQDEEGEVRQHYSFSQLRPINNFHSPISSTNLSPSRTLITTSTGSRYPPTVHVTSLLDPTNAVESQPLDSNVATLLKPPNVTTMWTSATNKYLSNGGSETLAVGTSSSILALDGVAGSWCSSSPVETESDVLAMDWLSPHTLAAGLRDATIMLYDSRTRGSVKRFRHSGAVIGVRGGGYESRLVVAGMANSLAIYDLRSLVEGGGVKGKVWPEQMEERGTRKGKKARRKIKGTQDALARPIASPILKLDYENEYMYPLGFDVNTELGLIAAAEDDGNVQTYSLRTGEKIRKLCIANGGATDDRVKCIRIVEDAGGTAKILASSGSQIAEYVW